jgi:Bacteriocin-protection, YdeI or OmpD-Associated/Domain of unknown function (DUF1905)
MNDPKVRSFRQRAARTHTGGAVIPVPFDPAKFWGKRDRYHVAGTIDGTGFRTSLIRQEGAWHIVLGPRSSSSCVVRNGEAVTVVVWPEGPQAGQLAMDISEALAARPEAQAAFDGLATFYRKGWLRWIEATSRRPEIRAERIAEMVRLVEAGHKQRP